MRTGLDQVFRQFLRFHFGRWTPRDDSNPMESWERAKREAREREEQEVLDSMRDAGHEQGSGKP